MKKLITLLLCLFALTANAQTTIYSQTFNSSYSDWSLNTSDLGGTTSLADNQWVVNHVYGTVVGGICMTTIPVTAAEPSGITGYPHSDYLHIFSEIAILCADSANCNFDASGTSTFFAGMNTPISTVGYTGVTFSFWWLCQGDAGAYGKVYYRTSSGGPWTALPSGPTTYYGSSAWAQQLVTSALFDGQAFLEFAFQFTEDGTGSDPAFAVDDIKVTGTPSGTTTPTFTTSSTSTCNDSCITVTNTSTGTVDSFTWSCTPAATITATHTSPTTICFTAAGTYTVTLTDYHSGTPYPVSHTVTVNPNPAAITGSHWVCVGGSTPLADATIGGLWSSNPPTIATVGSSSGVVTGVSAGVCHISYTLPTGCSAVFTFTVYALPCTEGITAANANDNAVELRPNPATNLCSIITDPGTYQSYTLISQVGQVLLNGELHLTKTDVDISTLPTGMYFISVKGDKGIVVRKLVKQ